MRRRTKALIATAVTVVVLGGLTAGGLAIADKVNSSFRIAGDQPAAAAAKTPTSTPTPTVVPIGGILDEQTALDLRREMPDNGDYAYKLPDGRWIKTNRHQPMPAEVMAAEQAKADAVPLPTGATASDAAANNKAAAAAAGAATFSTGRNIALVYRGLQGNPATGNNDMMWKLAAGSGLQNALGPGGNGFASAEAVVARTQQLIAARPDAADWDIIVAHQH